jgi:hypothetical protein
MEVRGFPGFVYPNNFGLFPPSGEVAYPEAGVNNSGEEYESFPLKVFYVNIFSILGT